jgi:predicted unusual protein kinase regulating ubiquinone biosynthesis (AarF/ABC1/UbiB family)
MIDEQETIASGKVTRVAALAGAGARVGINYLKHYGRRAVGGSREKTHLHEANARTVYDTFSRLKGGPLKMAQMLSIDKNMLPDAYRAQFAQAQYSAPTLSYPLVVRTFRRDMGKSPTDIFDTFSQSALHGASIGQVHRATIGDHTFAVKVQYPGVADSLSSDLAVVKPVALQMLGLKEKEVEPYFLEVKERLLEETDYTRELETSISLSQKTRGIPGIRFPRYYPEYSSSRVITMDWIDGKPLDRFAQSTARQDQKNAVAQAIWDCYHFQIHCLKQFHADPHPGNFLVTADNDVVVLDFGCTKRIGSAFHRDYFEFLDPEILTDRKRFEAGLRRLGLLTDSDSERHRAIIIENALVGAELLGRPFAAGNFDFGDTDYMASIFALGEAQQRNPDLKEIRSARGSVDAIYLNRAYFGLYSLMGSLRAQITTSRKVS